VYKTAAGAMQLANCIWFHTYPCIVVVPSSGAAKISQWEGKSAGKFFEIFQ